MDIQLLQLKHEVCVSCQYSMKDHDVIATTRACSV